MRIIEALVDLRHCHVEVVCSSRNERSLTYNGFADKWIVKDQNQSILISTQDEEEAVKVLIGDDE